MTLSLAGRQFKSPGPVASAFMADRTYTVVGIMGPVGGGKTVTCIHKFLQNAALMPVCRDGQIYYRCVAIRDTYDHLEKTTIATWNQWVPRGLGQWVGGGGRSAMHKLRFDILRYGNTVPINFEMMFAAIGDQAAQDFMRGFEPTDFWLNEGDLLAEDVLTYAVSRLGRYPSAEMLRPGDAYHPQVGIDLNAPDIDSWFYKRFEEICPPGHKLYKQPAGTDPHAENLHNLREDYYDNIIKLNGHKPRFIKRFVKNQYGASHDGDPVYPEYSDERHLTPEPLQAVKNVPVRIGLDAGLRRPAAVFGQWMPDGQWRILGELVPGRMGAKRFAEVVKTWLQQHAAANVWGPAYADPAGWDGADKEGGESAWAEIMSAELGMPIEPAPANELNLRIEAVRDELVGRVDEGREALRLSSACLSLRKGFASHYRFQRMMIAGQVRLSDKPEKNDYSHPHDALQYLLLGSKGKYGVIANDKHQKPVHRRTSEGNSVGGDDFNLW
jgi:hypothetical protein